MSDDDKQRASPAADASAAEAALRGSVVLGHEQLGSDGAIITAEGELDMATSPGLREQLGRAIEVGARRIVVDLSGVTFIDSLSLAAIVGVQNRLGEGGRLALVARHPYVLLILEAGGLDSVLAVYGSRDEALAHVGS